MRGAVISARGIGDGLLMSIAAYTLYKKGYKVTLFHDELFHELGCWFPYFTIEKYPTDASLCNFDKIIVQNDNSPKILKLAELRQCNILQNLHIFYPSYQHGKNPPLQQEDCIFDTNKTMVENVSIAAAKTVNDTPCKDNGMVVPNELIHKNHQKRVVIQPTSFTPDKSWGREKFIELSKKLLSHGFQVTFAIPAKERKNWLFVQQLGIDLPILLSLENVATCLYESGLFIGNDSMGGHLASCLSIPNIIIGISEKHFRLWRPGWLKGEIVVPPSYIPNVKGFRLRERRWRNFISVSMTLKSIKKMYLYD